MVFIKRSVVKLELTGEDQPEWLKDNKIVKKSIKDTEESVSVQDSDQEESE